MAASRDASEMMVSMAALILVDSGKEVSVENVTKILKAADVNVESYWPKLFVDGVKGLDIESLMTAVGSAPAASAAAPAAGSAGAAAAAPAKEEEEKKEEEEDDDMGFSLFD